MQWRGSEHHRSQLRGQPRHRPRSLLSFGKRRRTSKAQGYAWYGGGSMSCDTRTGPFASRLAPTLACGHLLARNSPRFEDENPCQLTPHPRPCSPTRLVTGALHRVKRETGESCALLKAMSVRCCPRNGKRAKRQIHCADVAWEGDACRSRRKPAPLVSPETGPQHKVTKTSLKDKPAVGGRCSNPCAPVVRRVLHALLIPR